MSRKSLKVVAFAFAIGNVSSSQTNWDEYYPLHIGDFWEYRESYDSPTHGPLTITRKVLHDSLMPNNKTYRIIEIFVRDGPYPGIGYEYQRVDSSGNVFGYVPVDCKFPTVWVDTLLYRLGRIVGDTIPAICRLPTTHWILKEKKTLLFWGRVREVVTFDLVNDVVRGVRTIAEGIGLILLGFEGGDQILQGAIINGKRYGNFTVWVERDPKSRALANTEVHIFPNPFNSRSLAEK